MDSKIYSENNTAAIVVFLSTSSIQPLCTVAFHCLCLLHQQTGLALYIGKDYSLAMYAKICSAWILVLISLGVNIFSITPSSLTRYVVRSVPIVLRPQATFSPQQPNSCNKVISVSAISGNSRPLDSANFFCSACLSLLTPEQRMQPKHLPLQRAYVFR